MYFAIKKICNQLDGISYSRAHQKTAREKSNEDSDYTILTAIEI